MKAWGSTAAVIAALRDDAATERERLEREAAATLAALREPAARAADDQTETASAARLTSVRRAAADAEAAEDWDDTVAAASDRDAWIAAVAEAGRQAIAGGADRSTWLARAAREAVAELPGDACTVSVPGSLVAQAEAWRAAVEQETGKRITIEAGAFAAGCVARTPDGRVTFDNTVEARERRLQTAWRTAVARVYDEAVAEIVAPVGAA